VALLLPRLVVQHKKKVALLLLQRLPLLNLFPISVYRLLGTVVNRAEVVLVVVGGLQMQVGILGPVMPELDLFR